MPKKIRFILLALALALSPQAWTEEPTAFAVAQQAADQGQAAAQAKLGAMYLLGNGADKDEAKAAEWLLKAAKQGYLDAQVLVAALFDSGVGVKKRCQGSDLLVRKGSGTRPHGSTGDFRQKSGCGWRGGF